MNISSRAALKNALLSAVRVYWSFSSLLSPRCRFWPSCSHYAYDAIDTHGAGRGTRLAIKRFFRCHPLGGHGFDPVPQEIK